MPHSAQKLLFDISSACEEIIEFPEGKNIEDLKSDRLLQLALERQFEIIGEAFYRLDRVDHENLAGKVPEYPKIISFRNVIIHGYDTIKVTPHLLLINYCKTKQINRVRSHLVNYIQKISHAGYLQAR